MNDTSPEMAERMREMFQKKTPIERLKMGFSMTETSRYLVKRAIRENNPNCSDVEMRQQLFLHFYGNDFDPSTRQKIMEHLASWSPSTVKSLS